MHKRRLSFVAALAVGATLTACTGLAFAGGGGVSTGGSGSGSNAAAGDGAYRNLPFGHRNLRRGNRGSDVKTLNWLLGSQRFGVPANGRFDQPTDSAVRRFQRSSGIGTSGVVEKRTRKAFAKRMGVAKATWYGPGLWGRSTACGKKLSKRTIGVAHKKLPCGTRVTFAYHGHWVRARVIDRGPYNPGFKWDLTWRLAKRLGFLSTGAGPVRVAVVR
jgi:hypothetical protein